MLNSGENLNLEHTGAEVTTEWKQVKTAAYKSSCYFFTLLVWVWLWNYAGVCVENVLRERMHKQRQNEREQFGHNNSVSRKVSLSLFGITRIWLDRIEIGSVFGFLSWLWLTWTSWPTVGCQLNPLYVEVRYSHPKVTLLCMRYVHKVQEEEKHVAEIMFISAVVLQPSVNAGFVANYLFFLLTKVSHT